MSQLLEILATRGDISFADFDRAIDYLYSDAIGEENANNVRRRIARHMEELAHCEFDYSRRRVYCCRPELVLLPGRGCYTAILTGARTPKMIRSLMNLQSSNREQMVVSMSPQQRARIPLPDKISVSVVERSLLNRIAVSLRMDIQSDVPAAWVIMHSTSSMEEYETTLQRYISSSVNWSCRQFSLERLHFVSVRRGENVSGLLEFTDPYTQKKFHVWSFEGKSVEIDRDWGRYMVLKKAALNVLFYDKVRHILGVPCFVPLPRLLARAAALSSGYAANEGYIEGRVLGPSTRLNMDLYFGVPLNIATGIAEKISQKLQPYDFSSYEEGEIND
ncbi:MAG: hypothetical protein LLG02_04930 [Pelosinus sp.]|nr:hypothetical protein [Pelosinus sp.]